MKYVRLKFQYQLLQESLLKSKALTWLHKKEGCWWFITLLIFRHHANENGGKIKQDDDEDYDCRR